MNIKNREYRLSERFAVDVLNLAEISEKLDLPEDDSKKVTAEQFKNVLMIGAQGICDSLKATYLSLPFYLKIFFLKYRKFLDSKTGIMFLLNNVGNDELIRAQSQLNILDGKKKVQKDQENELEEKSAKA